MSMRVHVPLQFLPLSIPPVRAITDCVARARPPGANASASLQADAVFTPQCPTAPNGEWEECAPLLLAAPPAAPKGGSGGGVASKEGAPSTTNTPPPAAVPSSVPQGMEQREEETGLQVRLAIKDRAWRGG